MYNAERSMENRRNAGAASRAAYRKRVSTAESATLASLKRADEDPNDRYWVDRTVRYRHEAELQMAPSDYLALTDALPEAVETMDWMHISIGWREVADTLKAVTYGRRTEAGVSELLAIWRKAAGITES